ncbi:14453_t:CDS:1 [Ambispora leptoticha]|uniref:14453_t:CDS:1 n=1 Tax=Ambispora leptoticha TaxID=144679 RepID=A0A9N9F303_9GLOM|nr:14453_t:CDS:1 [Ambispora leptoticha]
MDDDCSDLEIIKIIRDGYAPVPRIYYMICESIFFIMLFSSLDKLGTNDKADREIKRFRLFQAVFLSTDLVLILAMIIYRIVTIFKTVPSYDYADEFCTAFTVYNMTRFGLTLPKLFKSSRGEHFSISSASISRGQVSPIPIPIPLTPITPAEIMKRLNKYDYPNSDEYYKMIETQLKDGMHFDKDRNCGK